MSIGHLAIRLHRQMTTETARHPGRVTSEAGHVRIAMREHLVVRRHVAPGRIIGAHRLGISGLRAVVLEMCGIGIDRIDGLLYPPPSSGHDHGILNDVAGLQRNLIPVLVFLFCIASEALKKQDASAVRIAKSNRRQIATFAFIDLSFFYADARRKTRRHERRAFPNRAVTVDTIYFNSSARFVVKQSVAVRVLPKMTINAVHAFFEMDVVKMHCLLEAIRIIRWYDDVLSVEQVPFPITFENLAKDPAVTVKVREL